MRCLKIFLRKSSFIKGRLFSLYAGLAQLVRAFGRKSSIFELQILYNSGASSKLVKERIARQNIVFKSNHGERITREDKDIFIEDSPVD